MTLLPADFSMITLLHRRLALIWVFVTVRRKVDPKPTPTVARFVISHRPMRCWQLLEYGERRRRFCSKLLF